jgi:hypothetical protein
VSILLNAQVSEGYPHNKVLWTDASKWGWGAHLGTHQVAGQWPKELINHHINWLEMRAVWNALIEFQEDIKCVASMGKTGIFKCSPSICGRQKYRRYIWIGRICKRPYGTVSMHNLG